MVYILYTAYILSWKAYETTSGLHGLQSLMVF